MHRRTLLFFSQVRSCCQRILRRSRLWSRFRLAINVRILLDYVEANFSCRWCAHRHHVHTSNSRILMSNYKLPLEECLSTVPILTAEEIEVGPLSSLAHVAASRVHTYVSWSSSMSQPSRSCTAPCTTTCARKTKAQER